jgi:Arc/MetJ family transcription regulator
MRTTVTLDDELLEQASAAVGSDERSRVLHEGLKALIQRAAAERLIRLGGSAPGARRPTRRRPAPAAGKRRSRA